MGRNKILTERAENNIYCRENNEKRTMNFIGYDGFGIFKQSNDENANAVLTKKKKLQHAKKSKIRNRYMINN